MKNLLKIICVVALVTQGCSEETLVDTVIDETVSGAVLRNLKESSKLNIRDENSEFSITLEAQDSEAGTKLKEVTVSIGFIDDDRVLNSKGEVIDPKSSVDSKVKEVIPASAFNEESPTTNGLPVTTFTISLKDLIEFTGVKRDSVEVKDVFTIDFSMELTDGRVFNAANATTDVTRTGRFSYFNAQFDYEAEVTDPDLLVIKKVAAKNKGIKPTGKDTTFVTMDRKDKLVKPPTVTVVSASGATDYGVTPIEQLEDDKYFFIFSSAGSQTQDTISFILQGGEAVDEVPMVKKTFKNVYIIDGVVPTPKLTDVGGAVADGKISRLRIVVNFGEKVSGKVAFTISSSSFDTVNIITDGGDDERDFVLDFAPTVAGIPIARGAVTFTVAVKTVKSEDKKEKDGGLDGSDNPVTGEFTGTITL